MVDLQASEFIDRSLDDVFEFVSDLENTAFWQPIDTVRKTTSGPIQTGSKFRQTFRDFRGNRQSIECVITDFQPNKKFSYNYNSSLFSSNDEVEFQAADGGTHVTIRSKMEFGRRYRWGESLAEPHIKKQAATSLGELKRILESGEQI